MASAVAGAVGREGSVNVVAPPSTPGAPVKPRPVLNVLIGCVWGIILALAAMAGSKKAALDVFDAVALLLSARPNVVVKVRPSSSGMDPHLA